jgi:uncharacterized membrane-anchored protein
MKLKLFVLVLVLQLAWLLGTVATQETARVRGQVIWLETQPVDPRDLLRGDYLVLRYKISTVPTNLFVPPLTNTSPYHQTIWVTVAPRGEFHELVRASLQRFEPAANEVLLRGETYSRGNVERGISVSYGLEQFYVREGTGNPRGKITVDAVVPASGRASIKQVFLDGKPYPEAMQEQAR